MLHVVHRGKADENFGVLTITSYPSREEYEESRTHRMLDGSDRLVSDVYETVFTSEDYQEVRDYYDKHAADSRLWALRMSMNKL